MQINVVKTEHPDPDQTILRQTVTIDGNTGEYFDCLTLIMNALAGTDNEDTRGILTDAGKVIMKLMAGCSR